MSDPREIPVGWRWKGIRDLRKSVFLLGNQLVFRPSLRHSRETTHLCSPKVTHQTACSAARFGPRCHAAFAADDNATPTGYGKQETCPPAARMMSPAPRRATWQSQFSGWATLNEQRWVVSRECRGAGTLRRLCNSRRSSPAVQCGRTGCTYQ